MGLSNVSENGRPSSHFLSHGTEKGQKERASFIYSADMHSIVAKS